jgi:DNA replication protein DnaC
VLWLGPPGVGKSFLVQTLGYQAIKSGYLVYDRSVVDVVRDFMQDEAFGGQDRGLAKNLKPDLLAIDDMGMKQLPPKSGEFLFEIIMRRYELKRTMMTSNRPLEECRYCAWSGSQVNLQSSGGCMVQINAPAACVSVLGTYA